MTSPEAPDWTTPVQVTNDSVQLPGSPATLATSGASTTWNVSAYNTILLQIPLPAAALGARYALEIEWFTVTGMIRNDLITFHSVSSYVIPQLTLLVIELPVSGTRMRLGVQSASAIPLVVTVNGSKQTAPRLHLSRDVATAAQLVSWLQTTSVPINSSLPNIYIPPVDRAVRLVLAAPAADVDFTLYAVTEQSGTLLRFPIGIWTPNANTITVPELLVPSTALELLVTNRNTTTARNVSGNIFDVS